MEYQAMWNLVLSCFGAKDISFFYNMLSTALLGRDRSPSCFLTSFQTLQPAWQYLMWYRSLKIVSWSGCDQFTIKDVGKPSSGITLTCAGGFGFAWRRDKSFILNCIRKTKLLSLYIFFNLNHIPKDSESTDSSSDVTVPSLFCASTQTVKCMWLGKVPKLMVRLRVEYLLLLAFRMVSTGLQRNEQLVENRTKMRLSKIILKFF